MEDLGNNSTIAITIVTAIIGGIGYLVKYILNKRDENQKRIFEERDKDKAEIKENITNLQSDMKKVKKHLKDVSAMVLKCEHPDCPTKKILADYWEREEELL